MTRDFETKAMKGMEVARHHAGFKRKDRRSDTYPGRKFDRETGISEPVEVNLNEHPGFLVFPALKRLPALMTGDWVKTLSDFDVSFIPAYPVRAPNTPSPIGLEFTIHLSAFFRMVAKIAHCMTVARYGLSNFEPMLLDIIRGSVNDAGYLIGRCDDPEMNAAAPHRLHDSIIQECWINKERHYIVVMLRLFASKGAPPYMLVSGQLAGAPLEYSDDPEDSP